MRNVSYISTHVTDGGNRMLGQFWDTQAQTIDAVQFQRYQDIEDIAFPMIAAKYLANATGYTLNQIGALVGRPRPNSTISDTAYKFLVYGQIAANVSYGTKQDIYDILGALNTSSRKVYNLFPRSIQADFILSELLDDLSVVVDIIEDATHPIEINVTAFTEEYFGFDDDTGALGFDSGEIGEGA